MLAAQPSLPFAAASYFGGAAFIGVITWIGYRFPAEVWWPYPITLVISAWIIGQSFLGDIDAGSKLIPLLGVLPFLLVAIPLLQPKSKAVWPGILRGFNYGPSDKGLKEIVLTANECLVLCLRGAFSVLPGSVWSGPRHHPARLSELV
jgi:hypothetical protein